MPIVSINNVGSVGIIKDVPAYQLPPEAWSDGENVRFYVNNVYRALGYAQVYGTPSVVPGFVFNVPAAGSSLWVYTSLAAAYVYDAGLHTDITRAAGAYTATAYRNWNGCLLGGVPILNNGTDVPQYWPTLSSGTDLANLTNWTATLRAKVVRNLGGFLVALNLLDNVTTLEHAVQWSHPADPGTIPSSWDITNPAVDAGRTHLTDAKGGGIQDAILLGDRLIIYKLNSTHAMRFVGGQNIMGFEKLFDAGIAGHRHVALIDSGRRHFCVSEEDIFVHSGGSNLDYPIEAKDKQYLFGDIDTTNYLNSFCYDNPVYKEAVFAYPTSGQTYPNKALVWNYLTNKVSFKAHNGLWVDSGIYTDSLATAWSAASGSWDAQTIAWGTLGRKRLIAASPADTKLYGLENGYPFGTSTVTAFLQRTAMPVIGKDSKGQAITDFTRRKLVTRVWPRLRGSAPMSIRVGSQETLDGVVTWNAAQVFDPDIGYIDVEVSGRLPAFEFSSQSNAGWQLEGYDYEVTVLGSH